ncbi:MAG: WD40 repeat domain-containing protein [Aureispira sp.]
MLKQSNPLQVCILFLALLLSLPIFGQVQLGNDVLGANTYDGFGKKMAMSADGRRVASAGPNNDGNGSNSGHVRVHDYQTSTATWVQVGSDLDGSAANEQFGTDVDLSADGKRLVVLNGTGAVKIYEETNGTWTQLGNTLTGTTIVGSPYPNISFRYAVSISEDGKRVAVGSGQNRVRVFEEVGGFWGQVGGDITGSGIFGFSVALSTDGKRVVVGAINNGSAGAGAGQVRVFEESNGAWTVVGNAINGLINAAQLGYAVDISGDGKRVIIGAPYHSIPTYKGQVSIFAESAGTWTLVGTGIDGENIDDQFGRSVAISTDGKTVIGGAINNGPNHTDFGHARVFKEHGGVWTQAGNDIDGVAAYNHAGHDVAVSTDGYTVGLGAPGYNNSGHVRIFSLPIPSACIETRSIDKHYCQPRVSLLERTGEVHSNEVVLGMSSQGTLPSGAACTSAQAPWTHFNVLVEAFPLSGPMTTPFGVRTLNNVLVSNLYTVSGSNLLFYNLPSSAVPPTLQGSGSNLYRIRVTITGVNGTVISTHSSQRVIRVSPNHEYLCTTPSIGPGLSR